MSETIVYFNTNQDYHNGEFVPVTEDDYPGATTQTAYYGGSLEDENGRVLAWGYTNPFDALMISGRAQVNAFIVVDAFKDVTYDKQAYHMFKGTMPNIVKVMSALHGIGYRLAEQTIQDGYIVVVTMEYVRAQ